MKNLVVAALAAALLAVPLANALAAPAVVEPTEPVNYIVGYHEHPQDSTVYMGERVLYVDADLRYMLVEVRNPVTFEARAALDENARYVERDLLAMHATMTPNDTFYSQYQYGTQPSTTNIEAAWDRTLGSTSVKVCVTDTGLYAEHQDFAGLALGGFRDFVNGKTSAYDDNGHGTHVTGTIAAKINNAKGVAGIAQVTIYSAKVLNRQGSGTWTQVANGMKWCADQGAHVTSMSIGGGASSVLQDAVNYADGKGVLQVAAAGNSGPCSNCVDYPGKYAVVVAVSCTNASNALCSFSSTGPEVDFAAPGQDIPSTYPAGVRPCSRGDSNCYVLSSGTSMSTPHVSGLAALVKTVNPAYSKDQIYSAIQSTARDLGASGRDNNFGWGLIQGAAV